MSYAVQQPAGGQESRRPVTVGLAAALLAVMGLGGLVYAVATLALTPAVVDRFRSWASAADGADVDGFVSVVWVGAGVGTVLAVILFALYIVLALGLRRGSNASRVGVWVLCSLGLLAGCGTTTTVLIERSGDGTPGSLGTTLSHAYPGGWIGLNVALAVAQMIGYVAVAVLLIVSPGTFFGRGSAKSPATPTYGGIPTYGATSPYGAPPAGYGPPPGYGPPSEFGSQAGYPAQPGYAAPGGYGPPGYGPPGYGPPAYGPPAYGPPGSVTPPSFGPSATPGYSSPGGYERPSDYRQPAGHASSQEPVAPAAGSKPGEVASPPAGQPGPGPDDDFWSRPAD